MYIACITVGAADHLNSFESSVRLNVMLSYSDPQDAYIAREPTLHCVRLLR